jgi:hypothetical protein
MVGEHPLHAEALVAAFEVGAAEGDDRNDDESGDAGRDPDQDAEREMICHRIPVTSGPAF